MEDSDVQQQIKKRARRRLVGAVFFASLVAIVLPMVMDNEPKQTVQDVEIRIPGQDEKPFAPKFASAALEAPPDNAPEKPHDNAEPKAAAAAPAVREAPPTPAVTAAPTARVIETVKDKKPAESAPENKPKPAEKPAAKPEKPAEKPAVKSEKPADKPADKKNDKSAEKKPEKTAEKAVEKNADKAESKDEAKRAAAILAGAGEPKAAKPEAAKPGAFLVLIGAYANEANAKSIQSKLGELGIKTYSEVLDTPQGKKTRVRAGPFPNREAAEKAREKMQRIGVPGVVSGK